MKSPQHGVSRRSDKAARRQVTWVRRWVFGTWPGTLTGLLLWLSFPPADLGWLAFFALVPLLTLIRTRWSSRPIYRTAWAGGLLFALLAVQWLRYADDTGLTGYYGWFALAGYLSLYFPVFLLVARVAVLRFRMPAILAVPVVWVGLEYLRSWLLTGFPWYFLGHTQYRWTTLIQVSDLGGAYLVSFVVAMVNGWLLDLLGEPLLRRGPWGVCPAPQQLWRLVVVVVMLFGSLLYGHVRLRQSELELGPRVALVQTNVPQQVKTDESQTIEIHRGYDKLLSEAARELAERSRVDDQPVPQLIIWPETVLRYPFYRLDPDVTEAHLRRLYSDPTALRDAVRGVREYLVARGAGAGTPILMGVNFEHVTRGGIRRYNSALLWWPDGIFFPTPYHKIHLVPWGEYLPLRDWLPWLHVLTPHPSSNYSLDAGSQPVRFVWEGYKFGVLICFEDTVPWAARAYLRSDPVDLLVNMSNDGWFGGSSELDVHLAISLFRAVECRRPLVRAVNTGISAIIDSTGQLRQVASSQRGKRKLVSDVVVDSVRLDHRRSLYVRWGDWLGAGTLAATGLLLAFGFFSALARTRTATGREGEGV